MFLPGSFSGEGSQDLLFEGTSDMDPLEASIPILDVLGNRIEWKPINTWE